MNIFLTILILILIVPLSKIIIKLINQHIPLSLFQIFIGIILSYIKFLSHIEFSPNLFLMLFIPPLLFFDGINLNLNDFYENKIEIILLSTILVFMNVLIIGFSIFILIPNINIIESFILSSVLSPTDIVSVTNIINKKVPKNIMNILEGEALINDASGLVSLRCSILIITGLMIFSIKNIFKELIKVSFGGIIIGFTIVFVYKFFLFFINKFDVNDEIIQIILLIILPYISYLLAEHFEFSGILSSVVSGLTINKFKLINYKNNNKLNISTWKTLEFILNGIVFIILGLQLPIIFKKIINSYLVNIKFNIIKLIFEIIIIYILLILSRFIFIYLFKKINKFFIKLKHNLFEFNNYEILILSFSGIKGSITLAAILAIPKLILNINIYNRFIFISAGIIILSIIIGSLVLPILCILNKNSKNRYIK